MHDPRHIRETLGKLCHIAAVDDYQIGPQFSELALDRAMQLCLVQRSHGKRHSRAERLQGSQLYRDLSDRGSANARCVSLQSGDIREVPQAVAEAEDVHFVSRGQVADLVERGDLVAAVRRKRDAPAYVKNPHRLLASRRHHETVAAEQSAD